MKQLILLFLAFVSVQPIYSQCINGPIEATVDISICEGEEYNGIYVPGIYTETTALSPTCDSITTINLTVIDYLVVEEIICLDEFSTTQPGNYLIQGVNCSDSLIIIFPHHGDVQEDIEICEGESHLGYTEMGYYPIDTTDINGCPFVYYLNLGIIADCTSAIDNIAANIEIGISPNPSSDYISITTKGAYKDLTYEIFDLAGKQVLSTDDSVIDISSLDSAVYYVLVSYKGGRNIRRFVKE